MSDTPKNGFSITRVVLLVLCLVLGAVVYKVRQAHGKLPQLLRTALQDLNLEKHGLNLDFEKASVTLVGSFSHPIGLRIKNFKADHERGCNRYEIHVKTLVVPFKVLPLYNRQEVDLGLARFSDAKIETSDLCKKQHEQSKPEKKTRKVKTVAGRKTQTEQKVLSFFRKFKKINKDFLKQSKAALTLDGVIVYDLDLIFRDKARVEVDRFKALMGTGEVKYKADWSSKLYLKDVKSSVQGGLVGYQDRLEVALKLQEKESVVDAKMVSYVDLEQKDSLRMEFKSVPVSFITQLKKINFAGLNLRKTWVDTVLNLEISTRKLDLEIGAFKVYGDFGLIETDVKGPSLKWKNGLWKLSEPTQLKLQKIDFFEILAARPRKKLAETFKDVGVFNSLIKLDSLQTFSGDFETKDFSVSIRSRGRKSYQDIKFARGSLMFKKKEFLSFKLEDVGLDQGDFEGLVELTYDYTTKNIKTKFNIQHLKLKKEITNDLLGLSNPLDLSLEGQGFVSRTKLTKPGDLDYESDLSFVLKAPILKTKFWSTQATEAGCEMQNKKLSCSLKVDDVFFSDKLKTKLGLERSEFKTLKSSVLKYEKKNLRAQLKGAKLALGLAWSPQKGMVFSNQKSKPVVLRDL